MKIEWLTHLVSSTDAKVDSIIVGGIVVAMPTLCLLNIWEVMVMGREFSSMAFSGAVATILTAVGGGKRVRDYGMGNKKK